MGEAGQSPLHGRRVLITRAREQSESLVQRLLAAGAIPLCAPLIRFAPPEDGAPLDQALRNLDRFDWLFLTSQNALRFILERAERLDVSLTERTAGMSVAAVAPVTAAAAEKAGLRVSYVSKKHQGIGLAEELGPELKGKRVFLPRSDKASRELPEALRNAGAVVVDVTAYRTLQTQAADEKVADIVRRGEVDAIVFFSPSVVQHFSEIVGSERMLRTAENTLLVAIGPVTAEALKESGAGQILQATDTETGAVLDTLTRAFDSSASKSSTGARRG